MRCRKMIDLDKDFDDIMIEDNKQSIILLNGLSKTIDRANLTTAEEVKDLISMQQDAMKAEIKRLGGSYESS